MPVRFAVLSLVLTTAAARPAEPGPPPREARFDRNGFPLPSGAVARLGVPPGLGGFSWALGWAADGARFVVVDWVGVTVFDAATGREVESQKVGTEGRNLYTPLSRDGRLLFFLNGRSGVLYDTATTATYRFTLPAPFGDPGRKVYSLAVSADCRFLAGVSAPAAGPGVAWRYDLARDRFARLVTDRADLHSVRLAPDGRRIYATGGSQAPELTARDAATDKELWTVRLKAAGTLRAVSADGRRLALADSDGVRVYDAGDGSLVLSAPLDTTTPPGLWGIDLAPDGSRLAVAVDREVTVWDTATGTVQHRLPHAARQVAFSPDGKSLLTVSAFVQRWDLDTGKPAYPVPLLDRPVGAAHLHWSADGRRLLTVWPGDRRVDERDGRPDLLAVWDVGTGGVLARRASPSSVLTAALDPAGSTILACTEDRQLTSWPVAGAGPPAAVRVGDRFEPLRRSYSFLADGRLAVHTFRGGGAELELYSPAGEHTIAPDRSIPAVAAGRAFFNPSTRGTTLFGPNGSRVNLMTGRSLPPLLTRTPFHAPLGEPLLAPDAFVAGRLSAAGGPAAHLWESASGGIIADLPAFLPDWSAAVLSPDGRLLASADNDRFVVADLAGPNRVRTLPVPGARALAFSPDGMFLASAQLDGTVLIWDLPRARADWVPDDVYRLWADLAEADAAVAWKAVWHLLDHPDRAVELLKARLEPARAAKDTPELIAKLDHPKYAVREEAARRLAARGETVEMDLLAAYRTTTSAEQRERLEGLIRKLDPTRAPGAEVLRGLRAVWLLERIATADARRLLREMAGGASGSRVTAEAKAALGRLGK